MRADRRNTGFRSDRFPSHSGWSTHLNAARVWSRSLTANDNVHSINPDVELWCTSKMLLGDDLSPEHFLVPLFRRVGVPADQMDTIEGEHFVHDPDQFRC